MKKIIIIVSLLVLAFSLSGCEKETKIHQTDIRNEQGLPKLVPQVGEDARGIDTITITEEMRYPDMKQYETAKYDFLVSDPPETVADWFIANMEKSTLKINQATKPENTKWIVTWGDYSVDIIPYGGGGSLLRYKRLFKD